MNLINKIRNSFDEKKLKIIIFDKYINIMNYSIINDISNEKILINNKNIIIYGRDLKIIKLLDNELLIEGILTNLEYKNAMSK